MQEKEHVFYLAHLKQSNFFPPLHHYHLTSLVCEDTLFPILCQVMQDVVRTLRTHGVVLYGRQSVVAFILLRAAHRAVIWHVVKQPCCRTSFLRVSGIMIRKNAPEDNQLVVLGAQIK